MFDISWSEFLLIGVVALIVIGPKELPTVMRTFGQWTRKVRAMAADFQNQFQEAMREAEMADLKNEVDDLAHTVRSADPIKSVRDDFETMGSDFERLLDPSPEQASPAGETAPALTAASAEPRPDQAASAETARAETTSAETISAETTSAETTSAETTSAETTSAATTRAETTSAETTSAETTGAETTKTETATPPRRTERNETGGPPEAAEPAGNAEPANATGRTG